MKARLLSFLLLFAAILTTAAGQLHRGDAQQLRNSIDRFIDSESTGSSKFTTVVERDPATHEVVRVVKVRHLSRGIDIDKCCDRFEAERHTGRYSHKVEGDDDAPQHTLLLAVEHERQSRIYMLQYTGLHAMQAHDGKVTVVVKMKPDLE